jgi:hypothetical protein
MKINKYFDYKTQTLKVGFEPELFSEEDLQEAKNDLIAAGASETFLNEEIDEVLFENSYLDEYEDCENKEDAAYGSEEEIDENNFYIPEESEYVTAEEIELEDSEIVEVEAAGLWENIRKKKAREGNNYKPAKPGDKDRPEKEAWKKAQASEYQGRKVQLNKPFRTPKGPKKFSVYVKNDKGNIVKVNFGSPDMAIRRDEPARRKSFRARMRCDSPGPKWKARYWACRTWEAGKTVTQVVS